MDDIVKQIWKKPIHLAERVTKAADEASSCKQECGELKSKMEKLAALLQQAATVSSDPLERPTRRIIEETEKVLDKALSLVLKCRPNTLMKRMFTKIPAALFREVSSDLEDSIGNVSWLLGDDNYLGLPPIAANEPVVFLIWEHIAILYTGLPEDRSNAATSLVTLAHKHDRKLIIEEGGVSPLLKLLKEGTMEGQENAARAIGLLGCDPQSVEHMIHLGVCSLFAEILQEGPMKVQAEVAWAVSKFAANYPKCKDLFAQHNIINLLVDHLAFETVEENSMYATISRKRTLKYRTKVRMKEMTALALWLLAKGNSSICHSISKSKALLNFSVLLETGPEAVQYNSAMAIMEISTIAEKDVDLRESAFNPNSPVFKAIVDQMLKIIQKENSKLLIPCIKTIGNLAKTFKASTGKRVIGPLVRLLHVRYREVSREALISLTKYACTENDLHRDHSKAIISYGGAKRLIRLVWLGKQLVRIPALVLLSYLGLHVPQSQELAHANVLGVLEWISKHSFITHDEVMEELLVESKSRLELYGSKVMRGFHRSRIPV